MRDVKQQTVTFDLPPDHVFQAALGVVQNDKASTVLAVHNGGRKLVVRQKAKMSNPKFVQVYVEPTAGPSHLHVQVGSDDRSSRALMDGRANQKALGRFIEDVQGALDGSRPAPVTPVPDHFMQKKSQVPWVDPNTDPDIELGGSFKAMYGL
ncbi:hypothetical protein GCM10023340_03780 [Nocardioides marinquilinus]|uniref:Uncharacterized protein n=1 Tax=Nocardioides marinquilinus TaxID=1210400 RepID=A0ABP9P6X1_9ACTN